MAGPRKPEQYGVDLTQKNFKFLQALWGDNGQRLRDALYEAADAGALRALLRQHWEVEIPANVRLMLVDVQNARAKPFREEGQEGDAAIKPRTEDFYVLVLPPKPVKDPNNKNYNNMQCWTAAHYHAVNDSYGM